MTKTAPVDIHDLTLTDLLDEMKEIEYEIHYMDHEPDKEELLELLESWIKILEKEVC